VLLAALVAALAGSTLASAGQSPSSDLTLTKTANPTAATVGDTISYSIRVSNKGPDGATGVTVTDVLPGAVAFVSANTTQGTCSGTSTVTCSIGTLAEDAGATITIVVKANSAGTVRNTAEVAPTESDPKDDNNKATATTTVAAVTPPPPPPPAPPPPPPNACTITGTSGNETLTGTPGDDVICALGGNDLIRAGGGEDVVRAGAGNDIVYAGGRADIVFGGLGRDTVYGGFGDDSVYGARAADSLYGQAGDDLLSGGRGFDLLSGGRGDDTCQRGPGGARLVNC
jgi:uncharacterized repeat protein (TIGR01451 family)